MKTQKSPHRLIVTAAALALAGLLPTVAPAAENGVNLQPSYYNGGNPSLGFALMNKVNASNVPLYPKIKWVRIEIDPRNVTVARAANWLAQARAAGKQVILTFHEGTGIDDPNQLYKAAYWWKANYATLVKSGAFQVNLHNEWGSHKMDAGTFAKAYSNALGVLRTVYAGNTIIDLSGWGQATGVAQDAATGTNTGVGNPKITDSRNSYTLSGHIYGNGWNDRAGRNVTAADYIAMQTATGRPCILGEFGSVGQGADWNAIVDACRNRGWRVMGWAWNGDGTVPFAMNMITPSWKDKPTTTTFAENPAYFRTIYDNL